MQGLSNRQQGKQPLGPSPMVENDEFNALADEDREHIDEVVREPSVLATWSLGSCD